MSTDSTIRILSASDVQRCCDMRMAINVMRQAFQDLSAGRAVVPLRTNLPVTEKTTSLIMPVAIDQAPYFGLKAVSLTDDNSERNLPRIHASILIFDAVTGQPAGLLDGEYITALRTGAGSGLATDLLAPQDAKHLVVFGAGHQSLTQVQAVTIVRKIEKVTVVSRNKSRGLAFGECIRPFGEFEIQWTSDSKVVRNADIVCTATPSTTPLFNANDYPARCHLNAIGSYNRQMQEFSYELLDSMTVVVDQRSACLAEAGELVMGIEAGRFQAGSIAAELGELAAGLELQSPMPRTLFKSVGNAVQDLAVAQSVLEKAARDDIGQTFRL